MAFIDGKDTCGGKAFVGVEIKNNKVHIKTSEPSHQPVTLTKSQTQALINALTDSMKTLH